MDELTRLARSSSSLRMSMMCRCTVIVVAMAVASCAEPTSERLTTIEPATVTIDRRVDAVTSWAPSMRIGLAEGPAEYLLFRALDGFRTQDGTLFVANSGTSEIRVYSGAGQFLYSFGKGGEGPGEFRNLRSIEIGDGGSVLALDALGARISVFDGAGVYNQSMSVRLADAHQQASEMWAGSGSEMFIAVSSGLDPREMRIARDSVRVLRVGGGRADPELMFSVGDMWWESSAGTTGFRLRAAPEGPVAAITSRDGVFATSSNDRPAIEIRDAKGELLATWEDPDHPRGEWNGARDVQSLDDANERGRFYAQLQWSASGEHLWVGDAGFRNDETRTWTVVDRAGRAVGRTSLPVEAKLWQIEPKILLIKTIDDFGVERVEVWRPNAEAMKG